MNMQKIIQYLYTCRWCNFKEDIKQGRVDKVSFETMPFDEGRKLFVIGAVEIEDKGPKYFSMPLTRKASLAQGENGLYLNGEAYVDALKEPDFWQSLMVFMEENKGKVIFNNKWELEYHGFGAQDVIVDCLNEDSKPLGVEQSNTTLKIGDGKLAFKLERMLEFSKETNSELEMNEKLMRENCSVMPKTYGGLVWKRPDGYQASFGIVQEFVKNKGDMWNYLQDYLAKNLQLSYIHQFPMLPESHPDFMNLIDTLADKTKEMGDCFAKPDANSNFNPEKVDDKFIYNYDKQIKFLSYQVKKIIENNIDNLPAPTKKNAQYLLDNWGEVLNGFIDSRLDEIKKAQDKGTLNRVHGDFHLGQVMVTPDEDLRFIDFAGEPELTMEQRKQKYINVRDIAGMYRSIKGYLGAVAVEEFAAKSEVKEVALSRRAWAEKAIKPLIERASKVFLGERSLEEPWLALEVLRKNLYEVRYEVGNRPEMAYVPINGLKELLAGGHREAANENFKTLPQTGTERQ